MEEHSKRETFKAFAILAVLLTAYSVMLNFLIELVLDLAIKLFKKIFMK